MKYRAVFTSVYDEVETIKVCDSKEEAIEECVNYKYGHYSCDDKLERRAGLCDRGWAIIGYSGNTVSVEEVTV